MSFSNNNNLKSTYAWQTLHRVGGMAALAVLVLIPVQMVVFFLWPPPNTVIGWFTLFQDNALVGLLDMDLLLIVDYLLLVGVFSALWASLRRANESLMAIALILQLVATATYLASTVAFEMLTLSNQYATANTEVERSIFLAVGQAMLATWQGTAFDVSYVLSAIAILIVSAVMLRSHHLFSKTTGYTGLSAGVLALVPPTAGTIGVIFSLVSLVPMVIWLALIARRLLRSRPLERDPLPSKQS
ncbi:MAG TPA: hypothetical protein VHJ59_03370 [Nitrososphaera sp.]|nr:hypothetical protein [Nitrososphaera sp.]